MDKERIREFCELAFKRHQIYVLKKAGVPKPWTKDRILRFYRFCNVFRFLDKTSEWIIRNAIEPNEDNQELWKTIIMCRYISKIETLQKLKDAKCLIGNQTEAYNILRKMQQNKEKIFTNAFIVNSKTDSYGWTDKVSYLFNLLFEIRKKMSTQPDTIIRCTNTMEKLYYLLIDLPGIGPFMAYQYTVDFTYSTRYLKKAWDKSTWTQLGLGAVRGMNRLLYGKASNDKIPNSIELTKELLVEWKRFVSSDIRRWIKETQRMVENIKVDPFFYYFQHLDLRDVQHQLCEFDKYERGGSKKRRYNGGF
ncbi:hypothetical protein LCGC14_0541860 [marine sediment metagenome]|uniref:5-hmdU DNA kinase helical domain-containing protein n=1 Tax=marine sediment metagenome TaxID=412755 RepID=A0A0F9RXB5_9ZZZZ